MRGIFITFEGIDGCGKSTQTRLLACELEKLGYEIVLTREPGATPVGRQISSILLDGKNRDLCPLAEALLFAADRAQHVEKIIRPALKRGKIVISSRYIDSSLAYQSWGHGLPRQDVESINILATGNLWPDLTIVLDIAPALGLERSGKDRIESEGLVLQEKVRGAYLALAVLYPERIRIVSAHGREKEVFSHVWQWISLFLNNQSRESLGNSRRRR